jgi:uncharacterized protein YheU (UPF0270 family)
MASIIQAPTGSEFTGEQAKEYILKPIIAYGNLEDFFKVITDVKVRQQVSFLKYFDKITHKDAGCDSTEDTKQLTFSDKFWDPQPVEALLSQCYTDLYGTSFEKKLNGGTDKYKLEGTEVEALMLAAMVYAGDVDLKRMFWLGDKDILAANLTGGAGEVKNYNQVNGVWKKVIAGAVANLIPRYTITQNAASTTAGQVLPDGEAKKVLRQVFRKQSLLLKQYNKKLKRFFVTREIYDNYSEELSANDKLESARTQLIDGTDTLTFEGIPLEVVDVVDTYLASDFTFGAGVNKTITNPHRVLLTVKENIQMSVDTNTAYPVAFETWTEKLKKRWYGRAMYELDVQIAHEELISVAY